MLYYVSFLTESLHCALFDTFTSLPFLVVYFIFFNNSCIHLILPLLFFGLYFRLISSAHNSIFLVLLFVIFVLPRLSLDTVSVLLVLRHFYFSSKFVVLPFFSVRGSHPLDILFNTFPVLI